MTILKEERVRKLALCEAYAVVIRPSTPYIFEATPGCSRCVELLKEANEAYGDTGDSYSFGDPKTADLPIYANTAAIDVVKSKKSKKRGN